MKDWSMSPQLTISSAFSVLALAFLCLTAAAQHSIGQNAIGDSTVGASEWLQADQSASLSH